ncbi:hypothetical protein SMC26_04175 [Actinomadura fulvescens]|uniref:Uncharacterized protein n=1 Tax=Actinomadura fulvescens TaxID=46160 RepID=A0ABP6C4X7_9ACTN
MLSRSAGKPIFVGLGTAALVAAGGIPAWAETPSPATSTSASPSPSDPGAAKPALSVDITPGQVRTKPGARVRLVTLVEARNAAAADVKVVGIKATSSRAGVKPTVTGECPRPFTGPRCAFGAIDKGDDRSLVSYVTLPNKLDKTTTVTFTVTVSGKGIDETPGTARLTYVAEPKIKPKPKPKPSPELTPDSGEGPSDGKSGKGDSGSGSSGGSGNSGSGGSNNTPYVPPRPNGTFNPSGTQSPQVALPTIPQPSPSVAPSPAAPGPNSRLRGNERPVAQDLTFERMASTQVAWLAALMVAFSVLLTQLRLGRRRNGPATAPIRPKGTHRRPRHGVFGK